MQRRPGITKSMTGGARLFTALAALFLLCSCAAPLPLLKPVQSGGPQWPEAPLRARIQWVKSVYTPEDAGIAKSVWKKVVEVFTGRDGRNIVKPYGVLYDASGRLFIADTGMRVLHLMDTAGGQYLRITGTDDFPFRTPIALAEDELGGLYITDSTANTVFRYDLAKRTLSPFLELDRPTGIAYNRVNKLLYISETGAGRVVAVDGIGKQKYVIGNGAGEKLFNRPTDVAVDAKGQVYVNDPLNYKIKLFTPEGQLVSQFGEMGDSHGELNKPKGVAIDSDGHIYVCDSLLDAVQVFNEDGQLLLTFGAAGTDDGSFWMPSGIQIQGEYIFVSDSYNHRVQIFRYLKADSDEEAAVVPAANQREVKR